MSRKSIENVIIERKLKSQLSTPYRPPPQLNRYDLILSFRVKL